MQSVNFKNYYSWSENFLFSPRPAFVEKGIIMDQITRKTPNPKCRLYWCLTEFIDWRYSQSQSCWYFWPLMWTKGPLTFSLVHPPLPPFSVWISTGVCIYTVCDGRGRGSGCDESIYRSYTHSVFDQIPNLQNWYTTLNKNREWERASSR